MRRFCPSCGTPTNEFYGNLCRSCFLERTKIMEAPAMISSFICRLCGSIKIGGAWKKFETRREAVQALAEEETKLHRGAQLFVDFAKGRYRRKMEVEPLTLRAVLEVDDKRIFDTKEVALRFEKRLCDAHLAARGGYHEAIIQLRGPRHMVKDLEKRLAATLAELEKTERLALIAKINTRPEGADVFVGSRVAAERAVRNITRAAKGLYALNINRTFKLITERAGRRIYRETILIRAAD